MEADIVNENNILEVVDIVPGMIDLSPEAISNNPFWSKVYAEIDAEDSVIKELLEIDEDN